VEEAFRDGAAFAVPTGRKVHGTFYCEAPAEENLLVKSCDLK
jgi:hypothetical protein